MQLQLAGTLASQGRIDDAIEIYCQLLLEDPELADAHAHLGVVFAAAGRNDEARAALEAALALAPWATEVRLNLAHVLTALGRAGEAASAYREVIAERPDDVEALTGLAGALLAGGEAEAALRSLDLALAAAPDNVAINAKLGEIYLDFANFDAAVSHLEIAAQGTAIPGIVNNLGTALLRKGDWIGARRRMEALLREHPDYALGWHTLGLALIEGGHPDRAGNAFRSALTHDAGLTAARYGLAQSLKQAGAFEAAIEVYDELLPTVSDPAMLGVELAHALERLGRYEEAIVQLEQALSAAPDAAPAWNLMALCLINLGRHVDGLEACEKALALEPDSTVARVLQVRAHWEQHDFETAIELVSGVLEGIWDDTQMLTAVATMMESMRQHETAAKIYRRVVELRPNDPCASSRLLDIALSVCDWRSYDLFVASLRQRIEVDLRAERPLTIDVFNLQALPLPYELIAAAAESRARGIAKEAAGAAAHPPFQHATPLVKRDRIRLGYALGYTHEHSLPLVLKELVAAHDRDRFELYGYSIERCDKTDFSIAYRAAFDHFTDLPVTSPHAAARRIHGDELDLLFDVTGLTSQNCMSLMSFRPAPVQVHGFGYSITTGADYIDYLVTDPVYVPPEWAALGPEKPIYLPDTFMPTLRPEASDLVVTRARYGLPEGAIVFANFNHPCKFEPTMFSVWMRILAAVPDSVLWLGIWLPATQRNLHREAEARGIAGERLRFSSIVEHPEHCARLKLADLALDNLHHGGGITTVDALWSGLPVLTVRGEAPAARLGATLSRAAGVEDLVVEDLASYERLAIDLAGDPDRRRDLRERLLANRPRAILFDTDRFRRHFERGIEMAVARARAGLPPDTIEVPTLD
jgi:predicted O-linked N-acetylglucosamine transferase (SPINDLY family)